MHRLRPRPTWCSVLDRESRLLPVPTPTDRRPYRERMSADRSSASGEQRDGIDLTNLDQPLGPDAGATKRDLVNYLDTVEERAQIHPGLGPNGADVG